MTREKCASGCTPSFGRTRSATAIPAHKRGRVNGAEGFERHVDRRAVTVAGDLPSRTALCFRDAWRRQSLLFVDVDDDCAPAGSEHHLDGSRVPVLMRRPSTMMFTCVQTHELILPVHQGMNPTMQHPISSFGWAVESCAVIASRGRHPLVRSPVYALPGDKQMRIFVVSNIRRASMRSALRRVSPGP